MYLNSICQKYFNWNVQQWGAFLQLCSAMGCSHQILALSEKEYTSELVALQELNSVLQIYLFRAGKENPFGAAKERFQIQDTGYSQRHQQAAEALTHLGIHFAKIPESPLEVDAIFVLGSTVPNISKRLEFAREQILSKISQDQNPFPVIMGLSGRRKLVEATLDSTRGYLGDYSISAPPGQPLLTKQEVEDKLSKDYLQDGQATEGGAMQLLAERLLPDKYLQHWELINAEAKPGKDRPDTEDTAYFAGRRLLAQGILPKSNFKLAIVSDAAFPGQKEQVLAGLLKAGIKLSSDQLIFCGLGYSEAVFQVPAYVQIGASAIAEHVFNLQLRLELEFAYTSIQDFQNKFYPELSLTPEELETLSWCIKNPVVTPSGTMSLDVHFEVKRTLNRLSNIELLRQGAYEEFIRAQTEPKMSPQQFAFFAERVQALDDSSYQALRAITIISAIPFTPEAKTRAKAILKKELPADSIEFLYTTLYNCPQIYPAFSCLAFSGQQLLREAFSFGHLRHMLYIEGNQGMFKSLQDSCERIKNPKERHEYFNFWYLQWLINITGFKVCTDAQQDPHGSLYLQALNAQALIKLHQLMEQGIQEPEFIQEILPKYLAFRAEQLTLDSTQTQNQVITQIAAWSRLYTIDQKLIPALTEALEQVLPKMPADLLFSPLMLNTRTPTYIPAVFDNLLALLPQDPILAFKIGLSIYLQACHTYSSQIQKEASFNLPPLSLRLAADKTKLQAIINDLQQFPERQNKFPCCDISFNENFEFEARPYPAPCPQTFANIQNLTSLDASMGPSYQHQ